jgi:hypothetical protein
VPLAEFWYNSSNHSTLGHSPFELLYGHQPRHFGISSAQVYQVPELATWLQERQIMMQAIRQHLHRVQIRMKDQADKKRSEASFEVGEWVFLKLKPYVQSSLAPRAHQKLAFMFFGPYKILAKIGSVAYKLDLPAHSSIHPVFHVSLLKKWVSPSVPVASQLPGSSATYQVLEEVLES